MTIEVFRTVKGARKHRREIAKFFKWKIKFHVWKLRADPRDGPAFGMRFFSPPYSVRKGQTVYTVSEENPREWGLYSSVIGRVR